VPIDIVHLKNIGSSSVMQSAAVPVGDQEQVGETVYQEEAPEASGSSQLVTRGSHRLVKAFNSMLIKSMINSLRNHPVIYFTKSDSLTHLHRAIRYIRQNENSHKGNIRLVHIYRRAEDIPKRLEDNHRFLDELYPKIQIDLIFIQGTFDPDTIHAISQRLNVPKPAMFMSCPGEQFPYKIEEFGGAYVFFLNICAKWVAGIMATLAVLDYMATSVLSAASATSYLSSQFTLPSAFGVFPLTIVVIIVFGIITFIGVRESSTVASCIFVGHLITVAVIMVTALIHWIRNGNDILISNWQTPHPDTNVARLIWDGFCLGLLGVTGFESAESYLEDLKPGAFPSVINYMWICITVVNAPMTLLVMAVVPMSEVLDNPASSILALARAVSGNSPWLTYWLAIDAAIVLGAGVLTGMVGVLGLFERLARDQILPPFLLIRNKWTGVFQYIILFFTALCITLYASTRGDVTSLSGVFAVAFLCVMTSYSAANIMLYVNRPRLSRRSAKRVPIFVTTTVFGIFAASVIGNAVIDPSIFKTFAIYFAIVHVILLAFMNRVWILRRTLKITGAGATAFKPPARSNPMMDMGHPLHEGNLSDSTDTRPDADAGVDIS
ncbi:hypothetical protein BGZ99_002465, partial [Dissophora globulifera]